MLWVSLIKFASKVFEEVMDVSKPCGGHHGIRMSGSQCAKTKTLWPSLEFVHAQRW